MQAEHKIRTLAHQLAQILGVYAESFAQWQQDPSDLGRYERTHANLDLVRVLTEKAFPGGRGELGELLLCHTELKLLVLRRHMGRAAVSRDDGEGQLQELLERHARLVDNVRAICAQRSGQAAEPALRPAVPMPSAALAQRPPAAGA